MTRNIRKPGPANRIVNTGLGPKGEPGDRGKDGSHSQITRIIFVSTVNSPANLNGKVIPKDWDTEGSPKYDLKAGAGESIVYSKDSSIWTYTPANHQGGWVHTGFVNAEMYTEPGPKGLKGDPGFDGAAGKNGEKGSSGEQGPRGLKGEAGSDGKDGKDGLNGSKGQKGSTGSKGPSGVQGLAGEKGEQGLTGLTGPKGSTGDSGLKGEKGEQGHKGEQGETPNAHLLPAAVCTYDGVKKGFVYRHNITNVKHLTGAGIYSFRMDRKLNSQNAFVLVTAEGDGFFAAKIMRQDDRMIVVQAIDVQTGKPSDCTVKLMVYDTRG